MVKYNWDKYCKHCKKTTIFQLNHNTNHSHCSECGYDGFKNN